jgi:peroxiredoxin
MGNPVRFGVLTLGIILIAAVAYVLGSRAGRVWNQKQHSDRRAAYRSQALAHSAAVLERMGTIAIGDTLSNYSFEDIDGNLRRLSDILVDNTLLIYIKPDCDACLEEIDRLSKTAHTSGDYSHFILISTANPLHLRKLRDDQGLQCLLLYDEERLFGNNLKISSFPFGLLLNRERVIEEVYASVLSDEDIATIMLGQVSMTRDK